MAPYAKTGEVTLRLSTKAKSKEEADAALNTLEEQILSRDTFEGTSLRELCYGYGDETSLASLVVEETNKYYRCRKFDSRSLSSKHSRFFRSICYL